MRRACLAILLCALTGFVIPGGGQAEGRGPLKAGNTGQATPLAQQNAVMPRHPALTNRAFTLDTRISVKAYILNLFPNIGTHFQVLDAKVGPSYNCIAYSLGYYDRWINTMTGPAANPLLYMDQLYQQAGFRRAQGIDYRVTPGVKKVLLFAHVSGGRVQEVTHAAVLLGDGTWTSKLGQLPLVRYASPLGVAGNQYGQPIAMYEAPVALFNK
jgi:hypothetical protein